MRERFILFLTEDEIILHKDSSKKVYSFSDNLEKIQAELKKRVSLSPKTPLCLFIDRNHQDVRDEQLPPLMLWDRLRLLSHKKEGWTSQEKFHGYQFFKQDGKSFLQWINITQNDSLISWISWIKSLSNPLHGVFFVSLEAEKFLKKHFPSSHHYQMLIYKISSHKIRYVIFKGRRLLLLRPWSGEEDLRTSLHFLSRLYPDIHEKLHVLNLLNEIPISFPDAITLPDPQAFIDFLISQKRASCALNIDSSSQNQWVIRGIQFVCYSFLALASFSVYQSLHYQKETRALLSKTEVLKGRIQHKKALLKNKDVIQLRVALDHYYHLNSQMRDPFKVLETLSLALKKNHLRLENLIWNYGQTIEVEIGFFMQNHNESTLSNQFYTLLSSLSTLFPNSHIQIMEAPFKSGSHETYKYPLDLSLPMARIRIVQP